MQIEYPTPDDAKDMADLVKGGFPEDQLRTTIYGCPGIPYFIAENIRLGHHSAYYYQVAKYKNRTVGMAEFRFFNSTFFLNYIAIHPNFQSHGLAKKILKTAFQSLEKSEITRFSLDVFINNHRALSWYENLGLSPEFDRDTWVSTNTSNQSPVPFRIPDYAQSEAVHARLGFSEIVLSQGENFIKVGRLGSKYFRVPVEIIDGDFEWMAALSQLDPARELITSTSKPVKLSEPWVHVVSTRRMSINIQEMAI